MNQNEKIATVLAVVLAALLTFGVTAMVLGNRPGDYEMQRLEDLSYREGQLTGQTFGYQQGHEQGILEQQTLAELYGLTVEAEAYSEGWREGYGTYRDYGWDYR